MWSVVRLGDPEAPLGAVPVDVLPAHGPQLARPDEEVGQQPEGRLDRGAAPEGIEHPQDGPHGLGVGRRGHVAGPVRGQGPAQRRRGVLQGPPRGDGIAQHLADVLPDPVGALQRPAGLDGPQHLQDLRGRDLVHRALADAGEDVVLQAQHHTPPVACGPPAQVALDPLPGHLLEGGRPLAGARGGPAAGAQPGLPQADGGVGPQGQTLLLAVEAVLEPPELAPGGRDLQVEALAIEEAVGLVPRLGVADRQVGEPLAVVFVAPHGHAPGFDSVLDPPNGTRS